MAVHLHIICSSFSAPPTLTPNAGTFFLYTPFLGGHSGWSAHCSREWYRRLVIGSFEHPYPAYLITCFPPALPGAAWLAATRVDRIRGNGGQLRARSFRAPFTLAAITADAGLGSVSP